jgi:hypothetical protein
MGIEGISDDAYPPMQLNEKRNFTLQFSQIPIGAKTFRLIEGVTEKCNSKWEFESINIK